MKLPTSLGGMGIRAATSQLEVSFDTTTKKTRAHAERIERKLTGEREYSDDTTESEGNELHGTHTTQIKTTERTGPFKFGLVNASKGHVFSMSISTTLLETEHD